MAIIKKRDEEGRPARSRFSDFFDNDSFFDTDFFNKRWSSNTPATNIKETDTAYEIEVAAPGLKKEDFHIDLQENTIHITAEHEAENKEEEDNYTRREYNYSSFSRSFQLPDEVNADEIRAKYDAGVLRLTLPKRPDAGSKPRKEIQIN